MLTLHELTQTEFDDWFALSTQRQVEDRAQVSGRSIQEEAKQLENMIPHLLPNGKNTVGHIFRLAWNDGERAVAFVWFGTLPGMPADSRFLFDIYVVPEARRMGVGREVLMTMLDQLRHDGVCKIALNVLRSNKGAVSLYKQLGFIITDGGEDSHHFEMTVTI